MDRQWAISILALALVGQGQADAVPANEMRFECREGLLWVKASVAQSAAPLNLLLDTGAGVSVLNTPTAERMNLRPGRRIDVHGVEASLPGYALKPLSITVGGFQLPAPWFAVDLQKFSASCAQPVDGLVGMDFLRGRIVQIDFETHTLRFLAASPKSRSANSLPLELRPCGMRIPITINGRKSQWVRLDTGCVSPLQWVTSTVRPGECSHKTAIGLTALSIPQTETTVQIGLKEFQNIPTGVHEKPIFRGEAGLLGNGLLSRFSRITIDAKSGRLILGD